MTQLTMSTLYSKAKTTSLLSIHESTIHIGIQICMYFWLVPLIFSNSIHESVAQKACDQFWYMHFLDTAIFSLFFSISDSSLCSAPHFQFLMKLKIIWNKNFYQIKSIHLWVTVYWISRFEEMHLHGIVPVICLPLLKKYKIGN